MADDIKNKTEEKETTKKNKISKKIIIAIIISVLIIAAIVTFVILRNNDSFSEIFEGKNIERDYSSFKLDKSIEKDYISFSIPQVWEINEINPKEENDSELLVIEKYYPFNDTKEEFIKLEIRQTQNSVNGDSINQELLGKYSDSKKNKLEVSSNTIETINNIKCGRIEAKEGKNAILEYVYVNNNYIYSFSAQCKKEIYPGIEKMLKDIASSVKMKNMYFIVENDEMDISENHNIGLRTLNGFEDKVEYEVADPTIVAIENETIKPLANGTTKIKAKTEKGYFCEKNVKVYTKVKDIAIDKAEVRLHPGEETTITASIVPDNAADKKLYCSSSDSTIASVSGIESCIVKANKIGEATIKYTAADGVEKSIAVHVVDKTPEEYKAECTSYNFEQLARNPDSIKGQKAKVTGEVVQVMDNGYSYDLRVNITREGSYGYYYYTDTIYVTYIKKAGENKILEDDIITIYGIANGEYSYTSTFGAYITLPYIKAEYIDL